MSYRVELHIIDKEGRDLEGCAGTYWAWAEIADELVEKALKIEKTAGGMAFYDAYSRHFIAGLLWDRLAEIWERRR